MILKDIRQFRPRWLYQFILKHFEKTLFEDVLKQKWNQWLVIPV